MLRWLSPGEGWDAVGINCKIAATTENQGAVPIVWTKGCMWIMARAQHDLT